MVLLWEGFSGVSLVASRLLLDYLKLGAISLLGLSSGARLSAMFAAQYPKRVSKLLMLPTGDAYGAAGLLAQAYYGDCWELAKQGGMQAIVTTPGSQFQAQAASSDEKRQVLLSLDAKLFMNTMMNSQVFLESFTGEAFLGLFPEALRQLEVPTLIFHHGFTDDRLHALEDAETISQEMPQAQLLVESETQLQASFEDFEHVGWNEDKKLAAMATCRGFQQFPEAFASKKETAGILRGQWTPISARLWKSPMKPSAWQVLICLP
eukprot:symbB.v1.2.011202.t2/scaffold718.1/size169569/8